MKFETEEFTAKDGFKCNLKHLITTQFPTKGPVLLVHGAGVRADIFNPPTPHNLISALSAEGYDVWLENWRGSIDLTPNEWNLDQVALYDHPAAIKKIVDITGAHEIKAIIHCQGSTSFMISAVLGLVPEVKVIISNAVSLHPVVPKFSLFKINLVLPVIKLITKYLNPQWGLHAPDLFPKLLKMLVNISHWENDTLVGKFVSFIYGSGFPALWRLENLDQATKEWIQYEFAAVPVSFFDHIKKCIKHKALTPIMNKATLPHSYVSYPPKTEARFILFGGEKNQCFKPQSQVNTFNYLNNLQPDFHKLYILKGYSHLDVFFGKDAYKDVFPLMIKELNKKTHAHSETN